MCHAEGSGIKNMMARIFSRSSAPQDHAPHPCKIPLLDVFETRGKYVKFPNLSTSIPWCWYCLSVHR
jgi:hypothetical protein